MGPSPAVNSSNEHKKSSDETKNSLLICMACNYISFRLINLFEFFKTFFYVHLNYFSVHLNNFHVF